MSTSYPHFYWPPRLSDVYSYIIDDTGNPMMHHDQVYVDLDEDNVLDLDWVPFFDPKGTYRLRIFDRAFLDVKYEFRHKDPAIITKEIERIVNSYDPGTKN